MSECVIATSTQVKAPRLMLAKMESEEMEMTAEEIKRRDAETKRAQEELEAQRADHMDEAKKRQQSMAAVKARMEATGLNLGHTSTDCVQEPQLPFLILPLCSPFAAYCRAPPHDDGVHGVYCYHGEWAY